MPKQPHDRMTVYRRAYDLERQGTPLRTALTLAAKEAGHKSFHAMLCATQPLKSKPATDIEVGKCQHSRGTDA
jgi:hypothetical protein